jgi:hypothetical protein
VPFETGVGIPMLRIGAAVLSGRANREFQAIRGGICLAAYRDMLKLLGSIAIGRLLGFGVVGILVIYLILRMLG